MGDASGGDGDQHEAGPDLVELNRLRPRMLRVAHRLVQAQRLPADLADDVLCGAIARLFEEGGCPPGVPLSSLLVGHMLNEVKRELRAGRTIAVGAIDGEPGEEDDQPAEAPLRAEFVLQEGATSAEERALIGRDLVRRILNHLERRVLERDEVDPYVLLESFLSAYRAGAEKREDVCELVDLSPEAYEAAKKKLRYHLLRLPPELYVTIIEFIFSRRSRS